jgi:hypothetical protein
MTFYLTYTQLNQEIIEKLSDSLDLPTCPSWLYNEVSPTLDADHSLIHKIYSSPAVDAKNIFDEYFDIKRDWSSQKSQILANELINSDFETLQTKFIKDFLNAGLLLKFAIWALEETKYQMNDCVIRECNDLGGIFMLNKNSRNAIDQTSTGEGNAISSQTHLDSKFLNSGKRKTKKHNP